MSYCTIDDKLRDRITQLFEVHLRTLGETSESLDTLFQGFVKQN